MGGESLLEYAGVIEQLGHHTSVQSSENFIQEEEAYAFIDRVNEQKAKHHLLMHGKRPIKEVLSHALKQEAGMAAARMQKVGAIVPTDTYHQGASTTGLYYSSPNKCH